MYLLLNILAFFLLSGYALVLMMSKPSYVALSKNEKVLLTGREKFLLLTIATGVIATNVSIGMPLPALRLMLWIAMITMAFFLYEESIKLNRLVIVYALFVFWLSISLLWTLDIGFGIRVILKYIYPLLIMLFAYTFVKSKDFIFISMRLLLIITFFASLLLGGFTFISLGIYTFHKSNIFVHVAALSDYFAVMSGVSYLMWWRTKEKKYLFLIAWLLLSVILLGNRTGILGISIVFITASYLRYRVYSLPIIGLIFSLAILSVIFVPQINEKMFFQPDKITTVTELQTIDSSAINSNGRFAMWEWSLEKLYEERKLTGSGVGSLQYIFYSGKHPFGTSKIVHNDYVQILSDTGQIGIFLYLFFIMLSILKAMTFINKISPSYLHSTSFLVVSSFTATLTTMMTDNVVNYTFAAHSYPFIFLGILMANINIQKSEVYTSRNLDS